MTIEEAYEVLEAIDRGDDPHLAGELGDLLLQSSSTRRSRPRRAGSPWPT